MTVTTKAALAAELDISKARVSQYVQMGLPVRDDGKLNREQALAWIAQNCLASYDGRERGALRADRLAREARSSKAKRPSSEPVGGQENSQWRDDERIAAELIARAGRIAGTVAVELGLPTATAYALDQAVTVHLWNAADRVLGLTAGEEVAFEELVNLRLQANNIDWLQVASDRGEDVDETALDAVLNGLASLNPDGDLPALPH